MSSALKIGVELAITALLIGIVASYSYLAYRSYSGKMRYDSANKLMESMTLFYDYDNKTVTGSDIVEVITANIRLYTFEIKTATGTTIISVPNESKKDKYGNRYGISLWSDKYIRETVIGDNMFSKYTAKLTKNPTGDVITGIKFTQEGV